MDPTLFLVSTNEYRDFGCLGTRPNLTIVPDDRSLIAERAMRLQNELQGLGISSDQKTDEDGSIWLQVTVDGLHYEIAISYVDGELLTLILCCIDTLDTDSPSRRAETLERINNANLHSHEGGLTLSSAGIVTACTHADRSMHGKHVVAAIRRMSFVIDAYFNGQ